MSAMVMDLRPVSLSGDAGFDGATGSRHPRGRGFGVLSRIARTAASDDEGYSPRHRLEVEQEGFPTFA